MSFMKNLKKYAGVASPMWALSTGQLKDPLKIGQTGDASHLQQMGLDQINGLEVPAYDPLTSAYDGITEDPRLKDTEMRALNGLMDYADDGETAGSRARLNSITDEMNQHIKGNRMAVLENARARGVAGSGIEQANNLLSSQEASMNANRQGTQAAADAESRALSALSSAGTLGGNVRGQDYEVASGKAAAKDAIGKFNTGLKQQQFDNSFDKARALTGQYDEMAQRELEKHARKDKFKGDIIGTIGNVGKSAFAASGGM